MANLIEEIVIWRTSSGGRWKFLEIIVFSDDVFQAKCFSSINKAGRNEAEAISDLLDDFVRTFKSEGLKSKIIQGFQKLRDNDLSGGSSEKMEIVLVPEDQRKTSFSM